MFCAVWSQLEENTIVLFENIDFGVNCGIGEAKDKVTQNDLFPQTVVYQFDEAIYIICCVVTTVLITLTTLLHCHSHCPTTIFYSLFLLLSCCLLTLGNLHLKEFLVAL